MWKKEIEDYFEKISQHLHGEIEENRGNLRIEPPFGRGIETGICEYEGRSAEARI
jgi:hypothetical protein